MGIYPQGISPPNPLNPPHHMLGPSAEGPGGQGVGGKKSLMAILPHWIKDIGYLCRQVYIRHASVCTRMPPYASTRIIYVYRC